MNSLQSLEDARHQVLAENTAQDVKKYLVKLFQEEARFRSRWIWELLQNARDAAPEQGVNVSVVMDNDKLIFEHDGIPFTDKAIAHLIYHGSTKFEGDGIGQFGTGFLTTHLISRTVNVQGLTRDGGLTFAFLLDRRGSNADALKRSMDESWEAFKASLAAPAITSKVRFSTRFEYPLDQQTVAIVEAGIADLIGNAPFLLAFNPKIRSISICWHGKSTHIAKAGAEPLGEGISRVTIQEHREADEGWRYVVVLSEEQTSVAIEQHKSVDGWAVVPQSNTPRIFVAFPLTGTREFCLPLIVDNQLFQPREDRDTIALLPSRDTPNPNMGFLEQAFDLTVRMAVMSAAEGWNDSANLARLMPPKAWDWVDTEWLKSTVRKRLIEPLANAGLVRLADKRLLAVNAASIPYASSPMSCLQLWDLAAVMKGTRDALCRREEVVVWGDILDSWAAFDTDSPDDFQQTLTLEKLCKRVSDFGSVSRLGGELAEDVNPIEWINELHEVVSSASVAGLFERLRLIPSQDGTLKRITEVKTDGGIDEEIKDIAEALGIPVRQELLHKGVRLPALMALPARTQDEVLSTVVQRFKERSRTVDTTFLKVAVPLFWWIVRHDASSALEGLPILTRAQQDDSRAVALLANDMNKADDRLLAPVSCWPEQLREAADLFPKRYILADQYDAAESDRILWTRPLLEQFVRLTPLYFASRKGLPFIPDEPLPVSDKDKKQRHRTATSTNVSALAFFEKDDTGLDSVRRSKQRAVTLLRLLTNYVLGLHTSALAPLTLQCECGESHRTFPNAWLVPMWDRQWVPLGQNKQAAASAESLAALFDGRQDELRELATGKGRALFEALGISLSDLSLRAIAGDEDARISLLDSITDIATAAKNDIEKIRLVAEEIRESPGLLDEISRHRERRRTVSRNQALGLAVELALKEAMEGSGLTVTRTGIGSDYEVTSDPEHDFVVGASEVLFDIKGPERSFLIEIKASTSDTFKMTAAQASTAVLNRKRFMLCVVPLADRQVTVDLVRERCRFIENIGERLDPVWHEYERYLRTKDALRTPIGDVVLDVTDGDARFAVASRVCDSGLSFADAMEYIVSRSVLANSATVQQTNVP